ncbi:hypothetical protein V2K59_26645, partial [Pseudomonas alliivorans]|nr:hypothetical protein [Pseudomonas alliivorans]
HGTARQKCNGKPLPDCLAGGVYGSHTFGQQQETTVRKRGPAPKWQQQLEAIDQLPKSQQKFVAQMLDALIAQATTKASSEGREVLQ